MVTMFILGMFPANLCVHTYGVITEALPKMGDEAISCRQHKNTSTHIVIWRLQETGVGRKAQTFSQANHDDYDDDDDASQRENRHSNSNCNNDITVASIR